MFKLANNEQIGVYLKHAIKKNGYRSDRQFGKKFLEEKNLPTNDDELRKMSNRLSQILNGKKGLQLEDLPIFSKLLDMSFEEILSAGKYFSTSSSHITNYSIAMSKNITEWDSYIKREDKLILNADEYGKTVIDYALEFQNYDLLKYLTTHKYIWFVGTDEIDLFNYDFGAGTSIERNPLLMHNLNILDSKMKERYDFRIKMITLAINHNDTKMLTELRAREIPTLYQACCYSCTPAKCEKYFNNDMLDSLSNASDEILEYFSEEFEITDRIGITNRFMFPFTDRLINALIIKKKKYALQILKNAIKHNQYTLNKLTELLNMSVLFFKELYVNEIIDDKLKANIINCILRDIDYFDDGNIINYRTITGKGGIITNLIKVNSSSDNAQLEKLIREVNETYNAIKNITPKL